MDQSDFLPPFSQVTTAQTLLLVQGATLAAYRRPVASRYAHQCLTKLLLKLFSNEMKIFLSIVKTLQCLYLFLFNMKIPFIPDKTAASAVSLAAAGLTVAPCICSLTEPGRSSCFLVLSQFKGGFWLYNPKLP